MLDRKTAPLIHDFAPFTLPKPECIQLSNGIPLQLFRNGSLDLIHLALRIKAGSFYEPQKNVASFCYSMLLECHPTMSANEVAAKLDFMGAAVSVAVGFSYVSIEIITPKSQCVNTVTFVMEILSSPRFKEQNIRLQKESRIKDLEYNSLKVDVLSMRLMLNAFFGKTMVCGKLLEASDIELITQDLLIGYYQKTFTAQNIRVFVAGNVDKTIENHLISCLGRITTQGTLSDLPVRMLTKIPKRIVEHRENALQTSLLLCRPSLAYTDPENPEFEILRTILGGYFGSRLMQNLRETNGYTYGVMCDSYFLDTQSIFFIDTEVNNDKVDAAVEACFVEMKQLREVLVEEEELDLVKSYMLGSMLRGIDGTVSLMKRYITWDDYSLTEQQFYNQVKSIQNVNADVIKMLADKYLKEEDFSTIIVGNYLK